MPIKNPPSKIDQLHKETKRLNGVFHYSFKERMKTVKAGMIDNNMFLIVLLRVLPDH